MASRSSRSSLLGPPMTVAEDEDSILHGVQDENRPNWDQRRFANDAVIQELDRIAMSPPIEHVIKGFNEELDALTKSMESLFRKNRSHLETTASSVATSHLPHVSTARKTTPLREKDPPPTVSPLRNYVHSTPVRRSGSASYTPSEPPPAPVETPGFGFPTPNRRRTRRTTAPPRVDESYTSSQHDHDNVSTSHHNNNNNNNDNNNAAKLDELSKIVRDQAIRIQDLEIENEVLRKKLQLLPPKVERVHRPESVSKEYSVNKMIDVVPEPRTARHHRYDPAVEPADIRRDRSDRSTVQEEPEGKQPPLEDSPYRTHSSFLSTPCRQVVDRPPSQIQTHTDPFQQQPTDFTPGTRFVAELALLMKIERSHCVPLSMILDKHWHRLKQHFHEEGEKQYQR